MHRPQLHRRVQGSRASAAALLGVTRRTIENRLRTIELKLGQPVVQCGAELEVALRLEELLGSRSLIFA